MDEDEERFNAIDDPAIDTDMASKAISLPAVCMLDEECGKIGTRKIVIHHEKTQCEWREVECPNECSEPGLTFRNLELHKRDKCKMRMVKCENGDRNNRHGHCTWEGKAYQLTIHKYDCNWRTVYCRHNSCTWR